MWTVNHHAGEHLYIALLCLNIYKRNRTVLDGVRQFSRCLLYTSLLGIFNILGNASGHQFLHNEGLKQLDCHLLRPVSYTHLDVYKRQHAASGGAAAHHGSAGGRTRYGSEGSR